jgi:cell fate regulator YaaT (PSP1 superfamily)
MEHKRISDRIYRDEQDIQDSCLTDSCYKLPVFNWLEDLPQNALSTDLVEVRFKNTRKGIYKNVNHLRLNKGDIVAVEASPGHDIGIVSLIGPLVIKQLGKHHTPADQQEPKKIYRKAKPADITKWEEALQLEHETMLQARKIAGDLNLSMKIGDVEYQGDKTKAIFYYIADERVDFRELIKVFAETFKIRVEMRQIGARQEAGRIGGIGSCGRELCCSSWMTNFSSVTTNAAKYQELSLNPLKLAGQCGKLKCCLNYELDVYIDTQKYFPKADIPLETKEGTYLHQKSDIFKEIMWFAKTGESLNLIPVPVKRVKEIQEKNKKGEKPGTLLRETPPSTNQNIDFTNTVGQDSLTRFEDRNRTKKRKGKKRR